MSDIKNNVDLAHSLAPAARTATTNGASVDLAGYDAAAVVINHGAWTDGTHTFAVQESDDNATFAAVAAADLDGTAPAVSSAAQNNTVTVVGYRGRKRYLRASVTVAGATTGAVYSAMVLRANPRVRP
ncbi:MAG: hypothetical protein HOY78_32400 [Saccharothrix sp.]|nr:hypothetical protein [Saccharothrix sp.]